MTIQKRDNRGRSPKHLPPEVVHEIISLLSAAELFSVGLVNRTFQGEADRLLYRSIGHRGSESAYPTKLMSCLDTIAEVKSKAVLVKSLNVNWLVGWDKWTSEMVDRLCFSLPNMTSLTHLQLRIFPGSSKERDLMRVLQRSTFSLTTFYASENIIYRYFLLRQPSLKCLIFDPHPRSAVDMYHAIINRIPPENQLSLFSFSSSQGNIDEITSFPVASREWSATPIKNAIDLFLVPSKILCFKLYIRTLSDGECLRRYSRSISDNFGNIESLALVMMDDYRIDTNPEGLASVLSSFLGLTTLIIRHWPENFSAFFHSYRNDRIDLAKRWSEAAGCPDLHCISFPDRSYCYRFRGGGWNLYE